MSTPPRTYRKIGAREILHDLPTSWRNGIGRGKGRKFAERFAAKVMRRIATISDMAQAWRRRMEERERLAAALEPHRQLMAAVNRLTNWQRSQWAKAGYPAELDTVQNFGQAEHPHAIRRRAVA